MASITHASECRRLPAYLSPYLHPGALVPPDLMTPFTQRTFEAVLSEKPDPKVYENCLKEHVISFDRDVRTINIHDRPNYDTASEYAYQWIKKNGFDLASWTDEGFELFVTSLYERLTGKQSSYRSTPLMISLPEFCIADKLLNHPEKFLAYLSENNLDTSWYVHFLKKEQSLFKAEMRQIKSDDPIADSQILCEGTRAQLQKYLTFTPHPSSISQKMRTFFEEIRQKANGDQVELAAFVHTRLLQIHPFLFANGRLARLLMNLVLWHHQTRQAPVFFHSYQEYTEAVRRGLKNPQAFVSYLAQKVKIFNRVYREAGQQSLPKLQQAEWVALNGPNTLLKADPPDHKAQEQGDSSEAQVFDSSIKPGERYIKI